MNIVEDYDVLRLTGHNQNYYVSSAKVKGCLFVQWVKYHPHIPKEQILRWMNEIVKKLAGLHKSRGNPCYQYMNPYSIVVDEEEMIHFLDLKAQSNAEQIKFMQRRVIREHFLPPGEMYYQRASVELDIYGLGKTLQYFLSFIETEPAFTRREEAKIQKIITRCLNKNSKNSFKNVSEIQKYIPEYQVKNNKKLLSGKWIFPCILAAFLSGMAVEVPKEQEQMAEPQEIQAKEIVKDPEADELKKELGLIYFQELKDFAKSKEYFLQVKEDPVAENMAAAAECLSASVLNKTKLRNVLYELEHALGEEERKIYMMSILRSYVALDSTEAQEEVIRIGEECLENIDSRFVVEVQGYLATAYEVAGKYEQAVQMYEYQLDEISEQLQRVEIYKKMASIWESKGDVAKTQDILHKAIQEFPEDKALKILYIRMQLKDENVEEAIYMQTIETFIKEQPELPEDEEFQKLMKEYNISLEEKTNEDGE